MKAFYTTSSDALYSHIMQVLDTEWGEHPLYSRDVSQLVFEYTLYDPLVHHWLPMCRAGNLPVVQFLLTQCMHYTKTDRVHCTAPDLMTCLQLHHDRMQLTMGLCEATSRGHIKLVKYLVEDAGVDLKHDNMSALSIAVTANQSELVSYLLEQGAPVGPDDFIEALYKGYVDIAKCLVEHNADLWEDVEGDDDLLRAAAHHLTVFEYMRVEKTFTSEEYARICELACCIGCIDVVRYLVKHKCVNLLRVRKPLLYRACCNVRVDIAKYLVENGCQVEPEHLQYAAKGGHPELVQYLLTYMEIENEDAEDLYDMFGSTLYSVAEGGYLDILCLFADRGADMHMDEDELLRVAAKEGHLNIVQYLVEEHGCQIHTQGSDAVHGAIRNNQVEVVKYLVAHTITVISHVYLFEAIEVNNVDIAKYLIDQRVDIIHEKDNSGHTALVHAANEGLTDLVQYLIEKGANMHVNNEMALYLAAKKGHMDVVQLLVEHGACVNNRVHNAAAVALSNGFDRIAHYLIQHGAIQWF